MLSAKISVYKEYIRDFLWDSLTEQPIKYILERLDLYQEKFPILDPTFKLEKYSDEFFKKLFEDVYNISSNNNKYVVYTFTDNNGNRHFSSYTLEHFKNTVEDFKKNDRFVLTDSNFVDESNVLYFVFDGASDYFPQSYLM